MTFLQRTKQTSILRLTAAIIGATLLFFKPSSLEAQQNKKEIRIEGLKIFTEEMLIHDAGLENLPPGKIAFNKAAEALEAQLHKSGYTIAKAFLVEETDRSLIIFFDEGRIEKIIHHDLNTVNILRMRFFFQLPKNVYNENLVKEKLVWMKEHFNLKSANAKLVPVRDYSNSFFQIDRELSSISTEVLKLPLIDGYRPRYDLEIIIEHFAPSEMHGITYGLSTSYSKGLMPYLQYNIPSVFAEKDRAQVRARAGILYGLDRKFENAPRWTFMELSSRYTLPRIFEEHFTPAITGDVYRSWASRKDLGLSEYEYLILRGTLAPGITLFEKFQTSVGYGAERVYRYKSKPMDDTIPLIVTSDATDDWTFIEARMNINLFPWSLRRLVERSFNAVYSYYMNGISFHKFTLNGVLEFEFENFDILSIRSSNVVLSRHTPFYYEESVESRTFKGFQGKSFHTRKIARLSASYRFSIYRDYLFLGIFGDGTIFQGSGYDLKGEQRGGAYGISGHAIVFDQFEFNIYGGKDYLFTTKESNYNIFFDFEKKW